VERGKLKAFRRAVEDEVVAPGSYLLIEDFDRLSRMDPWDAFPIFQEIINSDITIVTLKDEKVWNKDELRGNTFRIMEPLFAMWNSHNESAKKSLRLSEVHAIKRKRLTEGALLDKPYKHGPGWLRWEVATKRFEVVPDRVALIEDIFAKADAGWGLDRIARWLNESKVAPWQRGRRKAKFWRGARIRRMLTNRAATGTLLMHKTEYDPDTQKRTDQILGSIDGYYPPVVDRELFERVSARLDAKAPRGRNAARPVTSLVAGVAKCAYCESSVIRVSKGEYVYLVCARAHAKAGCKYQAIPYREVEKALRLRVDALIDEAPRGGSTEDLDRQMVGLEVSLDNLKDDARELLREFRRGRSPSVGEELRKAERDIAAAEAKLQELRDRRERLGAPFVVRRLNALREELKREELDVDAANRALKTSVQRIVLNPETGLLEVHWRDSDAKSEVRVMSRHIKSVFPDDIETPQAS
jgi:DNA invertase Pin-like site-specific DNA recombinase